MENLSNRETGGNDGGGGSRGGRGTGGTALLDTGWSPSGTGAARAQRAEAWAGVCEMGLRLSKVVGFVS